MPAHKRSLQEWSDHLQNNSEYITETGCLIWLGPCNVWGYGKIKIGGKTVSTHRFTWMLHKVGIPPGLNVLHHCDVRCCINIKHLFLGTHKENTTDMFRKGRAYRLRGNDAPWSKVTSAQVAAIRSDPRPQKAIAADYGIDQSSVSMIKNRVNWKHV